MSGQHPNRSEDGEQRSRRIDQVLSEVKRRLQAGDSVSVEPIIAGHQDLMPELGRQLKQMLRVHAARQHAGRRASDNLTTDCVEVETHEDSDAGLHIRCPHCRNPIEVVIDAPLHDILCGACGSNFSLVEESVITRDQQPLKTLGHFELVERLGVGGFGAVWKARDTELDRTVAVKVPRKGQLSSEELEKFVREARTAAQLRHPNIVSVHEIGRSDDTIYIVCDLIRGISLSTWMEYRQPTPREAAAICATIAEALHHAHEQGVVHRDLKPQNVMVDEQDQPHVMDFGLARREAGEITMTVDGQVLGTPAYMSPEQARGEAHEADRRSDVYSLGVILFELLTGELPFRGSVRMLIQQVLHDEPPGARKLNSEVPRDLETISQKCMEKDPRQRYQTAHELADDLRRYSRGEPITARPLGRPARLWRWCRRKPLAASFIASAATGVTLVAIISLIAAVMIDVERRKEKRARQEADRALSSRDKVVAMMTEILQSPDPERDGRKITVAELLDDSVARLHSEFGEDPLVRTQLLGVIGSSYASLGLPHDAIPLLEESLLIREREPEQNDSETLQLINQLAWALHAKGDLPEALPLHERAFAESRVKLGENHPDTLTYMGDLAYAMEAVGRADDAALLYKEASQKILDNLAEDERDTLTSLFTLARALELGGRVDEVPLFWEQALKKTSQQLGEDHSDTLSIMRHLADALYQAGRFRESVHVATQTFNKIRAKYGENHPRTLSSMSNLSASLERVGRVEEALVLEEETLEKMREVLGEDHPNTLTALSRLAAVRTSAGQFEDALVLYEQTLAKTRAKFGETHPHTLSSMSDLGSALQRVGRLDEALELLERVLMMERKRLGADHRATLVSMGNLALTLDLAGRGEEALPLYQQTLEKMREKLGADHPDTLTAMSNLGSALLNSGSLNEALLLHEQTLKKTREKFGEHHPHTDSNGQHGFSAHDCWSLR